MFLFFVIQNSYADDLNGKNIFCEDDSFDVFIEFKPNNKAVKTIADYSLVVYESNLVTYGFKEVLGEPFIDVDATFISRTKGKLFNPWNGYSGKCKLVNKDLTKKMKKKFDKLQNKNKKKKELKF